MFLLLTFQLNSKVNRDNYVEEAALLSKKLHGVTIVSKGEIDVMTNGEIGKILFCY